MTIINQTSIIIPLSPTENNWPKLILELNKYAFLEVILVGPNPPLALNLADLINPKTNFKILKSTPGRAASQNLGASIAQGKYLWFLHADSILPKNLKRNLLEDVLERHVKLEKSELYYFILRFSGGKSFLMKLTEFGTKFRSEILGIPFGDQGFFLKRELFYKLGMFNEKVNYGEDHLFVWQAKNANIPIRNIPVDLFTSPRKYRSNWLKTTFIHFKLTWEQALPEFIKIQKKRFKNAD